MHVYAFGSVCRGELDSRSDLDVLVVTEDKCMEFTRTEYSNYTYARLRELWREGSPFAWHLHKEAVLLHDAGAGDYLVSLGMPEEYTNVAVDCRRFVQLFKSSCSSLAESRATAIFDVSTIFLAVRNFASCYSLGVLGIANFSRRSALALGSRSLRISEAAIDVLERARLLSTRGRGEYISTTEVNCLMTELGHIGDWFEQRSKEIASG